MLNKINKRNINEQKFKVTLLDRISIYVDMTTWYIWITKFVLFIVWCQVLFCLKRSKIVAQIELAALLHTLDNI